MESSLVGTYEVIVIGLGTAGSATCMELARRGVPVCGLDALEPPHTAGSHHGRSRSVRRAYMEGTSYVPMAMRAWELWNRLEARAGVDLLFPTGNLTLGPEGGPATAGVLRSARAYGIAHEALCAREIRSRWPALVPPNDFVGVLEVEAGIVLPELAVTTMLREAAARGAELRTGVRALSWRSESERVVVTTDAGTIEAGSLVIAAGARSNALLEAPLLVPRRVPVCWFEARDPARFGYGHYPVNFWQLPEGSAADGRPGGATPWEVYSLPITEPGGAVKVAAHNRLAPCEPDSDPERIADDEIEPVRDFARALLSGLAERPVRAERCFYATTADGEFHLGPVPGQTRVFMGAFAGHGFKFAPVLGEVLADLATGRDPGVDLTPFTPGRRAPAPDADSGGRGSLESRP